MKQSFTNKKFQTFGIKVVLFVYFATILLQSVQYFFNQKSNVLAEKISEKTDVVALFVDKDIYNLEKNNIQWYATSYIQKRLPGTVALVMPIEKTTQAYEIQRGLDNLYFEGMKDKPSSLKGVILIGDLPLPVVNYNNGYFPTVYPYTDFVNKKYVYNPDTKFFEFTKIADAQPEIWHSLINFGTGAQAYDDFFVKLKVYDSDPQNFVTKKIYYDDFIDAKQKFNGLALKQYINKMIFSDDIANHRYSTMLLNFLGYDANGNSVDEIKSLEKDVTELGLTGQIAELDFRKGEDAVRNKEANHVPTKLINESVDEILKAFKDVVGDMYLVNKRDNVSAGGRYLQSEVDGFDSNIDKLDDTSRSIIDKMNAVYEEKIDEYAKQYQTNIIVPSSYKDQNLYYENYLFGTPAKDIKQAKDLSFYRGTYNSGYDVASLQAQNLNYMDKNFFSNDYISNGFRDSIDVSIPGVSNQGPIASSGYTDPMAKSNGLSLGIFNTLVAYNRLYDLDEDTMFDDFEAFSGSDCKEKEEEQSSSSSSTSSLTDEQMDNLSEEDKQKLKDEEMAKQETRLAGLVTWAMRLYGGGSPLAYSYARDDSADGFYFKNAILPLLDQKGSKREKKDIATEVETQKGTTYLAGKLYGNLIYSGQQTVKNPKCYKNPIHESWQNAANSTLNKQQREKLELEKQPYVDRSGEQGNPKIWVQKGRYGGKDDLPFYGTSFNMFEYTYQQPDKDFSKWELAIGDQQKLWSGLNHIGFYFSGNEQQILSANPGDKKLQFTGDNFEDLETYVTGDIKFYTGLVLGWKEKVYSGDNKLYPLNGENLRIWDKIGILTGKILPQVNILQKNGSTGVVVGYTGALMGANNFVKDFTGVAISLSGTNNTGGALSGITLSTTGFVALNTGYVIQNSGYAFVTTGFVIARGIGSKNKLTSLPTPTLANKTNNRAGCLSKATARWQKWFGITCNIDGDENNGGMTTTTGDNVDAVYKTIPSIVKHINPIESDINKMGVVTPDRAIDTKRITFQGQNGTLVEWYYPNFYDVPVYKKLGNDYVLKTQKEIEDSVREYLKAKTDTLNKQIQKDFNNPSSGLFLTPDNCSKTLNMAQCRVIFSGSDQFFSLQIPDYKFKEYEQTQKDALAYVVDKIESLDNNLKKLYSNNGVGAYPKDCFTGGTSISCKLVINGYSSLDQNTKTLLSNNFNSFNTGIINDFALMPSFTRNSPFKPLTGGNFGSIKNCVQNGQNLECSVSFYSYQKYLGRIADEDKIMKFSPADKKLLLNMNPELFIGTGRNQQIKTISQNDMLSVLSGSLGMLNDEQVVASIAKALYQQNGGWETKAIPDKTTIGGYLSGLKSTFAPSEKVKYAVDQSIKVSSNAFSGNKFIYPTQNASGYEVAFINSDGKDMLGDASELQEGNLAKDLTIVRNGEYFATQWKADIESINWSEISISDAFKLNTIKEKQASIFSPIPNNSYTPVGRIVDESCSIPPSGSVPLKNWIPAFNCWLKETTKAPFKATLSYACSQGPVLKPGDLPKAENVDLDLDNNIQVDVVSGSTFTNEQFSNPVALNFGFSNFPNGQTANITFRAKGAEGKNCVNYNGSSLCNRGSFEDLAKSGVVDIKNVPMNKLFSTNLRFETTTPDDITIIAKIETKNSSGENISTEKEIQINMIAGSVDEVSIDFPSNNIIKGGQVPFTIQASSSGNKISQGLENIKIKVDQNMATILGPSESSNEIVTSQFGDAYILDTSKAKNIGYNTPLQILVSKIGSGGEEVKTWSRTLNLVSGKIDISDTKNMDSNTIKLQDKKYYYSDGSGTIQFNTDTGSRFDISVKGNSENIPSFVSIRSKNGLVKIGEASVVSGFVNGNWINQTIFSEKEVFELKKDGAKKTIYLIPTMKAGKDQLIIETAGVEPKTMDITIQPGEAKKTILTQITPEAEVNKPVQIGLQVTDQWNNPTDQNIGVLLSATENISFKPNDKIATRTTFLEKNSSSTGFTVYPINGGKAYVSAILTGAGAPVPGNTPDQYINGQKFTGEYTLNQVPAFLMLKIGANNWYSASNASNQSADTRISKEGLNAMYVNLFGSDWGNIFSYYTSTDKDMIKNLFSNSPKTLAITTQIVKPENLRKVNLSIDKNIHVINNAGYDLRLEKNGNSVSLVIGKFPSLGKLKLGDFVVSQDAGISNRIYYVTGAVDNTITSNQIKENKIFIKKNNVEYPVLDLTNMSLFPEADMQFVQEENLAFNVLFDKKVIGKIVLKNSGNYKIDPDNLPILDQNKTTLGYSAGSTNSDKNILFLSPDDISYLKAYKSIEDSSLVQEGIGFRSEFKNITNFAGGANVGDSTKFFASEFLINYGDPLIGKINNNPNINKTNLFVWTGERNGTGGFKTKFDNSGNVLTGMSGMWFGAKTGDVVLLKNYIGDLQLVTGGTTVTLLNSGYKINIKEFLTGVNFSGSEISFVPLSGSFKWYKLTTGSVVSKTLTGPTTLEMSGKQLINLANFTRDRNKNLGLTFSGNVTGGFAMNMFFKKQKLGELVIVNSGFDYKQTNNLNPENEISSPTTGLDFDMSMGKQIYGGSKQVSNAFPIDFNDDGQKDVAIAFSDGSVRLMKNYQGDFQDVGELMFVGDGIKEIFAGKTMSGGQEDIFIRSAEDRIRVYQNSGGAFDVDGRPLCIDVPTFSGAAGQMKVDVVSQMLTKDINDDGLLDIITNDKAGDISVFWGGASASGHNYISSNTGDCDAGWKERSKANKTVVYSFGLSLKNENVQTDSLLRWKGLENTGLETKSKDIRFDQGTGNSQGLEQGNPELNSKMKTAQDRAEARIDQEATPKKCSGFFSCFLSSFSLVGNLLSKLLGSSMKEKAKAKLYKEKYNKYLKEEQEKLGIHIMDPSTSTGALTQSGVMNDVRRYVDIPSQYKAKPFDDAFTGEFVTYIKGNYGTRSDPVKITKSFSGETNTGNLVEGDIVIVKLNVTGGPSTVIDKLDGPFDVLMSGDRMYGMSGDFENEIKQKYSGAIFDSGNVPPGYLFKLDNFSGGEISYKVKYQGVSPVKFKLKTEFTGGREVKTIRVISLDECLKRIWDFEKTPSEGTGFLNKFMQFDAQLSGKLEDINNNVEDHKAKIASGGTALLGAIGDSEDWTKNLKSNGKVDPNAVMSRLSTRISQDYTKIQRGLCNGFKFGNSDCEGLPVPFNVSFLDPGMFNVMGYPIFFSPGMPIAWDYWMGPPQFSQIFRLYVSPTLTLGMGVSLCLGPYAAGTAIPQPFAAIGGNCIVAGTTMPFMCKSPEKVTPSESVIDWQHDLQDTGVCGKTSEEREEGKNISPLEMSAGEPTTSSNPTSTSGGTKITVDLGIVSGKTNNFKTVAILEDHKMSAEEIEKKKQELQPGIPINLKVQSGLTQGLVESIIKKWLDKQIQYVVNNLTSMTVYMYLPDFNGLTKGFDKVSPGIQSTVEKVRETKLSLATTTGAGIADRLPSKQALASISDSINNPFEQLGELFNETNLLKVKYDDVNLNVPFIYQEDLKKYQSYLNEYIDVTNSRIESWKNILNNIKIDASIKGTASANFELQSNLLDEYTKLLGQLKKNRDMLQQYAEFPFKLYDYVHVVDRYVYEISCIVKKFLEGTTGWLADNSMRFEKWVNAAMLAIVALDSWQILIDFTVQWKTKCGKCTVDNYDYHSFMLSLLNFEVPIIKIPNFRLPDIYLDFSKFDIGSTITLPRIKFIPQSVPLPRLPVIPAAPSISIFAKLDAKAKLDAIASLNVNLPDIPVLPAPPKLPEIPSVIPTLELKLPTLPPAPEIPKLSTKVSGFVKVAGQIATIFLCIIKGKIGLVGESDVKTKVEQITQRTRRLRPFDFLRLRVADPPVEGKDIKIESFVRLRADTDILYDFLNKQAKKINSFTSKAVNSYSNAVNNVSNKAQSTVDKAFGPITKASIPEIFGTKNNISKLSDSEYKLAIQSQMDEINKEMDGLEQQWPSSDLQTKIEKLQTKSQASRLVQANYKGMQKVSSDIENFFVQKMDENDKLLKKIQTNYTGFLQDISQPILVSADENEKNFSLKLFSADSSVEKAIQSEKNPVETYLSLANQQVSQINETLANSKNVALDDRQLQQASSFFYDLENKIERLSPSDEKRPLAGPAPTPASSSFKDDLADPTQGVVGVYLENLSGDIVPGFGWSQKSKDIQEKNSYVKVDMNNDGSGDILFWDDRSVSIKYAKQATGNYEIKPNKEIKIIQKYTYKGYYVLDDFKNIKNWRNINGQSGDNDFSVKTYSDQDVVNRFRRGNQNFESINYLWDSTNPASAGYLLRVQYRIDVQKDKLKFDSRYAGDLDYPNKNKEFYVFIVDRNKDILHKTISLTPHAIGDKTQLELDNTGDVRVIPTNMKNGGMSSIIEKALNQELGRNWAYVSAAPIGMDPQADRTNFVQTAGWSAQALGGISKRDDDQAPIMTLGLVRKSKNEYYSLPDRGNFNGLINTHYVLSGYWDDNNMVVSNTLIIQSNTGVVYSGTNDGGKIPEQEIYSLVEGNYNLEFSAQDTNDNVSTYTETINIKSPEISISVEKKNDGLFEPVVTLSQDIDDGKINFERCDEKGLVCEQVVCDKPEATKIQSGKTEYRGCYFGNQVTAYTDNTKTQKYAIIDKTNGNITPQVGKTGLDFSQKITYTGENNQQLDSSYNIIQTKVFSGDIDYGKILLSVKTPVKVENNVLQSKDLNTNDIKTCFYSSENGGVPDCEIVIGKNGVLAIQNNLQNQYIGDYEFKDGNVIYTFYKNGQQVLKFTFKANPL